MTNRAGRALDDQLDRVALRGFEFIAMVEAPAARTHVLERRLEHDVVRTKFLLSRQPGSALSDPAAVRMSPFGDMDVRDWAVAVPARQSTMGQRADVPWT